MNFLKGIMVSLGTISLVAGIIGVFIPGLPTTPFILLSAALYIRSSDKLYQFLISNKYIGPYIIKFHTNRGMTFKSKILAICTMWVMIYISCTFIISPHYLQLIVSVTGVIGTIVMGIIVPTAGKIIKK